jgi:ornithine cyclodeaminase/alanine dehydrogenase-like protein (mu-crystallin family)
MSDDTLILSGGDVRALLPPSDCIEVVAKAMRSVSRGGAALPLRIGARVPGRAALVASMPGYLDDPLSFGGKLISVIFDQPPGAPSHQGIVALFDVQTGKPQAILDAHSVTLLRTAAASAMATRALARADSNHLAILGTGEQAEAHIVALMLVRPFRSITIWGRSHERAVALITRLAPKLQVALSVSRSVEEAVADADVICTVTSATEPILEGGWVKSGAHVNLVGASSIDAREADDALVLRGNFFVDFRGSAMAQAGELSHACRGDAGAMAAHIRAEIGEVLNGSRGRRSAEDLTIYKSLGIAAQDLAAAQFVYGKAVSGGLGTRVRI